MNKKYQEKRSNPRVKFTKGINYKVSPRSRFNLGLAENISIGGIGLITFESIPEEEKVLIEMQLNKEIIRVSSMVVWSKKFQYSIRYRMGFKFDYSENNSLMHSIKSTADTKRIISNYVNHKLSG